MKKPLMLTDASGTLVPLYIIPNAHFLWAGVIPIIAQLP